MRRLPAVAALAGALTFTAAAVALGGLSGTYTTKVTAAPSAQLKGIWSLVFSGPRYTIKLNGKPVVAGKAAFEQGTATFTDTSGPLACKGAGNYRYLLALRGRSLSFVRYSDPCVGRRFVLSHRFTKTG